MRALLLIMLAAPAWGQLLVDRPPPLRLGGYAWFEAAPTNGAGMPAACACTGMTSAQGDTLNMSRSSGAFCNKAGMATTGIQNGDLVYCAASDSLRVEPNQLGVRGPRQEVASSNLMLQSEAFDNVIHQKESFPVANPPRFDGGGYTGPDNGTTADRYYFAATSGTDYTDMYQVATGSVAIGWTCSVFVKGAVGSGTTDICGYNGLAWSCSPCSFNASTWSWCFNAASSSTGTTRYCKVGNNSNQNGNVARSISDVLLFGLQGEELDFPTSYIPTTSATASRSSETPYFTKTFSVAPSGFCTSATIQVPNTRAFQSGAGMFSPSLSQGTTSAVSPYFWPYTASAGGSLAIDSLGMLSAGAVGYSPALDNATTLSRYVAGHNGTAWFYCVDGVCRTSGSGSTLSANTFPYIRIYATAGVRQSAIWTNIQVDNDWTRCAR